MFVKLMGAHKGSQIRELFVNVGDGSNDGHIALIFNRDKRVIIRLIDGVEIALDKDYADAEAVVKLIAEAKD